MQHQKNRFLELVDNITREPKYALMRPVVEKELLHYDILFALDHNNFLDGLTFQGGTALRLCYGGQRFSEDLDFVGGYQFKAADILPIKTCLEEYLSTKYELQVAVKEPKEMLSDPITKNASVSKWQIQVTTHPERRDLPAQKIKIEVANIPAYTREPKQFINNYGFLPDGYNELIIMTESLDEIMVDKIVAFVDCQSYIRYRDIWDLHWLQRQGAKINMQFISAKLLDYSVQDFAGKVAEMKHRLPDIIASKEFMDQMSRFLPIDIINNTLKKPVFCQVLLQSILQLYDATNKKGSP